MTLRQFRTTATTAVALATAVAMNLAHAQAPAKPAAKPAATKPAPAPKGQGRTKTTAPMEAAPALQTAAPALPRTLSEGEFDSQISSRFTTDVVDTKCNRLYDSADTAALVAEFAALFLTSRVQDGAGRLVQQVGSSAGVFGALGTVIAEGAAAQVQQEAQRAVPGQAAAAGQQGAQQSGQQSGQEVRERLRQLARTKIWVPPAVERELAKLVHQLYVRNGDVVPAARLNGDRTRRVAELQGVLDRLTAVLPVDNPYKFELSVIRGNEVNARVGVGGYIYVTEGLLDDETLSPDQTAMILSHEMAHITRRHALKDFQLKLVDLVGIGKDLRSEVMGLARNPVGQVAAVLQAANTTQLMLARYDQHQELEADHRSTPCAPCKPMWRRVPGKPHALQRQLHGRGAATRA
jgi:hypothetical protein